MLAWRLLLATGGTGYADAIERTMFNGVLPGLSLSVRTQYPWEGRVTVHIVQTPDRPWTLSLRVPCWCNSATLRDSKGTELHQPAPARCDARGGGSRGTRSS